jgi:hypothetical protein
MKENNEKKLLSKAKIESENGGNVKKRGGGMKMAASAAADQWRNGVSKWLAKNEEKQSVHGVNVEYRNNLAKK